MANLRLCWEHMAVLVGEGAGTRMQGKVEIHLLYTMFLIWIGEGSKFCLKGIDSRMDQDLQA